MVVLKKCGQKVRLASWFPGCTFKSTCNMTASVVQASSHSWSICIFPRILWRRHVSSCNQGCLAPIKSSTDCTVSRQTCIISFLHGGLAGHPNYPRRCRGACCCRILCIPLTGSCRCCFSKLAHAEVQVELVLNSYGRQLLLQNSRCTRATVHFS